jgi:hypothetical protein
LEKNDHGNAGVDPDEEKLGGPQGLGDGHRQFAAVEVVVLAHQVPADVGNDGNQPVLQHVVDQVYVHLFHAAGMLVIEPVQDAHGAGAHPIAHHAVGPVLGQKRYQGVGHVGGAQLHQGHGFLAGDAHVVLDGGVHLIGLQHLVDGVLGPRNQYDADAYLLEQDDILDEQGEQGLAHQLIVDLQDEDMIAVTAQIPEDLADGLHGERPRCLGLSRRLRGSLPAPVTFHPSAFRRTL